MSQQDKDTAHYSAGDIERYLKGELSPVEMHALEHAALDDPFLADAIDGMAVRQKLSDQPPVRADLADLNKRLAERTGTVRRKRVIPLFLRYAAAITLLVGLGLTAWLTLFRRSMTSPSIALSRHAVEDQTTPPRDQQDSNQHSDDAAVGEKSKTATLADQASELAKKKPASPAAVKSQHSSATDHEAGPVPAGIQPAAAESGPPSPALARSQPTNAHPPNGFANARQLKVPNSQISAHPPSYYNNQNNLPDAQQQVHLRRQLVDSLTYRPDTTRLSDLAVNQAKAVSAKDLDQLLKGRVAGLDVRSKSATAPLEFSGKVTDELNRPLPGARLALSNNQQINAITDKNGYFSIRVPNASDTASTITVNRAGFLPATLALHTENQHGNVIHIRGISSSLNEVTVVGYGAKRRELLRKDIDAKPKALSLVAVPSTGWPAYNQYLENSKHLALLDSSLRGLETVSFLVNKKGELHSFRVEQSISPAHDSATINMIKKGPSWILLSGKKERARVILLF